MFPELRDKKLFIFDMDGILVDTSQIHERAFKCVLSKYDAGENFQYQNYAGLKTIDVFDRIFNCSQTVKNRPELEAMAQEKSVLSLELIQSTDVLYRGVLDLLSFLKAQGKLMGLASSASQKSVEIISSKYNLSQYFKFYQSASDVKKAKPDPEIFLNVLHFFQISKNEAVVIEDSVAGLKACESAGIDSIAVATTHPASELKKTKAKLILNEILEMKTHL